MNDKLMTNKWQIKYSYDKYLSSWIFWQYKCDTLNILFFIFCVISAKDKKAQINSGYETVYNIWAVESAI